jgi:hypothetical protein
LRIRSWELCQTRPYFFSSNYPSMSLGLLGD